MSYWDDEIKAAGYVELASIDESEFYEVDMAEVYYVPTERKFILRTASGCSCWDGDYDETKFDTLPALREHLLGAGNERYTPSLSGAVTLMDEAEATFAKLPKG